MIDIDINQSDVNQCASDQQLFSESNKCLPETTQVSIVTQAWNLHLQKYIFFLMKILDENSAISWFFFFIILITFIHMKKKNIGYNYCSFRWFQCVHIPDGGLRAGSYKCVCQKGFYFPDKNSTTKSFPGSELEQAFLNWYNNTNFSNVEYQCLPCPRGCENCVDDTRCMAEYNVLLRGIPLGIQSFCITVTIVIGIVVLRLRKSKVNASYISVKM